ncbi:MAG: SRPBCC family protein [Thermoleophilia bacterium]|nr:SRPBCC family protein [Thermoleophilia bacterium]
MATLDFSRTVAAPVETVWEVVADQRGMSEFTRFRKVELEREGDPPPNGVGTIRVLHLVGPPAREEIITFDPPHRFAYKLLSGLPVKDHVGTIELSSAGEGTRMSYVLQTTPKLPLVGFALVAVIRNMVESIAAGIAGEAEKRAAG